MSVSDILKTRCLPTVHINPLEGHCSREDAPTAWVCQEMNMDAPLSAVDEVPQALHIVPSAADAAVLLRSLRVPLNERNSKCNSETRSSVARLSDSDDGRSSSSENEDGRAMPSSRAFTMASGWFEKPFVTEGPHFEFYMKLWNSPAGEALGDPWKQSVFVRKNMRWWTEKSDDTSAQDYKPSYETNETEISGVNMEVAGGPALPMTRVVPYLGRPWELL